MTEEQIKLLVKLIKTLKEDAQLAVMIELAQTLLPEDRALLLTAMINQQQYRELERKFKMIEQRLAIAELES